MIIYRPSSGNAVTPVDIDNNGNWFGESIGNNIIKEKSLRVFPFNKVDSKLLSIDNTNPKDSTSNWFFKNATDFDFIRGSSTYRCIYIGCESDIPTENFFEYIEFINANVSHTQPTTFPLGMESSEASTYIDNSIKLSLWYEGKYNIVSSKNTLCIVDEMDSTGELEYIVANSSLTWQNSIYINEYLKPGEYLKIWIKCECVKDKNLLDYSGYSYTFTINDLLIKNIEKIAGRLNTAKVYSTDLTNSGELGVKELLSLQVEYSEILKIVDKNGLSNIFYLDTSNKIHNLIVKNQGSISQNKFIDYDFSTLTDEITSNSNYAFARVVECLDGNIQHLGEIKNELKPFINKKFIIDIILSNKEERYECYIFFNELKVNNYDTLYEVKYNHISYSWSFGVIKLDLSFSNYKEFDNILSGYNNKKDISVLDSSGLFILKNDYFASSVILQDDLFTIIGYEIEDCKIDNKKTYINYLWEKDIIKNDPKLTTVFVPKTKSTEIISVENVGNKESYLIFNDISKINSEDFNSNRHVKTFNDTKQYIQLSSPHEKEIKIGSSSVTYDAVETIDDFSYTCAFNIDESSIQTDISTTITGNTTFNDNYAPHKHILLDSIYKDYTEFKHIYRTDKHVSYVEQQIRQDGIQIEDINPYTNIIPITGNSTTSINDYAYLQEILTPSYLTYDSTNFGKIVKLSGDGNTSIIVIQNYLSEFSKVLIYKRCGVQWGLIKELVPYSHDNFNLGQFLEISDEDKIDINKDGTKIIISSKCTTKPFTIEGITSQQFNYNGYIVRTYETNDEWTTYTQNVLPSNLILPKEQKIYLTSLNNSNTYNFEFGHSVSISDDGDIIAIGSPDEYFPYKKYDDKKALLDSYNMLNNGVTYILTTNSLNSISVLDISASLNSTPNTSRWNYAYDLNQDGVIDNEDLIICNQNLPERDYIYGDNISGSNWNFVFRLIPYDSMEMKVGGISYKECLSKGIQGKRFGEKVRLDSSGLKIAISAKNDNQIYLNGGAVYMYNISLYIDACVNLSNFKTIKVIPSSVIKNMNFSMNSMDFSRDANCLIVGCINQFSDIGVAYLFNTFDWDNLSQHSFKEYIIHNPTQIVGGNFGLSVKLSKDASVILIKDKFSIKQFNGNSYDYFRRYTEFNKISKVNNESGETIDISDDGFTIGIGCIRDELYEDDRVFIFDDYPALKSLITSINCPTTGTTGTSGTPGTTGTSGNQIIISDLYSIPIYYLIEVNYIPKYYNIKTLIDELLPKTIIGKEIQEKQYKDENIGVIKLHCNGNESIYALDVAYNFKQKEWVLNYFNNKAQQVTTIIGESEIDLSPNFTNVITINITRKQVNAFYCGKRYFVNFDICCNGRSIYKDSSYTFDTTNTYVVTYNQYNQFISSLSYMEVRSYLENIEKYNNSMSIIYSNVYWPLLDIEQDNSISPKGFENFIYKRKVTFNNLPFDNTETIVVPIVLQGNAYNVNSKYNTQIRRSIFNFSKIDIASPSFAFSYEGGVKPLSWSIDSYDINKDSMVIWIKLEEWNGQKLLMYYGDIRYITTISYMNPFDDHFAAWKMNRLDTINRLRYDNAMVYNGGEAIIVSRNGDKNYITQIDKHYMIGNKQLYKSNKFDISYDDSGVIRTREEKVKDFIKTNTKLFVPGFMEIRDIKSTHNLLVESNSSVGEI